MSDRINQPGALTKFLHFVPYSAGLLFVLGVLVENVYLNYYGITDVSLFRIQYIIVGAEFALFLSFPFISVILPFHMIFVEYRHLFTPRSLKVTLIKLFICLTSFVFLISAYLFLFRFLITERAGYSLDSNILHHLPPISLIGEFLLNQIFEAVVIYFLIFLVPIIIPRNFPAKFVKAFMRTFSGLFIVLYFVAGLSFYPGLIHAFIARSFSGGQPILADIRVAEEFAKFGQEIGKNLLTGCLMQRQVVIYSDSNNIYLLRYEGRPPKTIVIPKKYVEYMIIHKQENKGNQTKIEKTETPAVKEKLVPD